MRLHILAVLVLAGCPSPGLHGSLVGLRAQDGYSLGTDQVCERSAEVTRIADRVLVLSLHELTKSGHVKSYHEAVKSTAGMSMSACLIRNPEKCRHGGWTLGPFGPKLPGEKYPLAARKRGCASMYSMWASACWPPACRPEWKDEPHCVAVDKVSTKGWEDIVIHELFNAARARWAGVHEADYSKLPRLFGPGGVKSKVVAAYKASGYHNWPRFGQEACK
jgi:hypothetical protein